MRRYRSTFREASSTISPREAGSPPVVDLHCTPGSGRSRCRPSRSTSCLPALERVRGGFFSLSSIMSHSRAHGPISASGYGGVVQRETARPRGLPLIQNHRAKEYLASNLSGEILVADVSQGVRDSRAVISFVRFA